MATDPWRFQKWAFDTKTGNAARKAVLSMLAMMADCETGRCEAKQDTLAQGVEMSERSVRAHLKILEMDGLIARRAQFRFDRGRRGDEYLLLAPGVECWPDGAPIVHPADLAGHPPAGSDTPPGVPNLPGKNNRLGTTTSQTGEEPRASSADEVPDDFPDELRPHAREVMRVLRSAAASRGARRVTTRAVALTIAARPRKPLVKAAHDCAAWIADHPEAPCVDVVSRYRRWLDREPDLEAPERLGADGMPASVPREHPPGVTPIHRDKVQAREDRYERRKAGYLRSQEAQP